METMNEQPKRSAATRQSLLNRLKNWQDHAGWQEFFDTYWKLIFTTARKAGLTETEAEEVLQETFICLSKQMSRFEYDPTAGSFKSWLMRLTGWRIRDQLRKRNAEQQGIGYRKFMNDQDTRNTATVDRLYDPRSLEPAQWDKQWELNLIEVATDRVKTKVDAKQFQIFDLYVNQQWPVRKIASILKVNVGQVYLAKHRIQHLIRKEAAALKAKAN